MNDTISKKDVVKLLRTKWIGGNRTLTEAAKKLGVRPSFLSRVFSGQQDPSTKLLDTVGVVKSKVTIFKRVSK